ncbi:hypothetical protein SLS56_012071 [Neofusicoccum ribis]|uniref:Uncharacterized protein n=1 Tax=Neofusicoccum ribis TaxID=45134 RepID=A0ABR3S9U6_9PEZI
MPPVAAVSTDRNGDAVINIPENVADILNSVLDSTICHRAVGIDCVSRGSTSIIKYTKSHPDIFKQLKPLIVINIAPLADKAVQLAIDGLADTAKGVAELSDDQLTGYATAIFFLVYSRFVLHHGAMTQATVAADVIATTTSNTAPSQSSTPCPPEDRIPICSNCGGRIPFVPELSKCLGVGAKRVFGRCDCIDGSQYDYYKPHTYDSTGQAILADLPDLPPYAGKCAANISQVQNTYGGSTVIPYQYGVDLFDPMGTQIGSADKQTASESKPLDITSQLPYVFILKPLGTGETVQFLYAGIKWDDSDDDSKKKGYCDQSTWSGTRPPTRELRCYFTC